MSKHCISNVFEVTLEIGINLPLIGSEERGYAEPGELTPTLTVIVVPPTALIAIGRLYTGSVALG